MDHGALIAADHGIRRSPRWPAVMHAHLRIQPACLVCGKSKRKVKLNVHHCWPYHYVVAVGRSDLELDPRNLYTLDVDHDEEHHLLVGHLDSFASFCPDLHHMMALCRGLLASQIRSMPAWIEAVKRRPKPLAKMTRREKDALRDELDRLMPLMPIARAA